MHRAVRSFRLLALGLVLLALTMPGVAPAEDKSDEGFVALFNGKDFSGFKFFLDPKAKDADPTRTWSVVDGTVHCTGKPYGYFYTDKSYKDYVLRYDWRYPAGSDPKSNSGCLVHIQPPHKIWPRCVEPQGRYMDHGKLFTPGLQKEEIAFNKFDPEALKKALRPMGVWSTTEVTCEADGTIRVKVNGIDVSSGKTVLTEGPIGWQSEGAEVHFKEIKLRQRK
jgi:Domain of Unknown Function (DUF1080)